MPGPRILVADDDDDFLESVVWLLCKEGFHAKGVSNGVDALREIAAAPPDLVLLDLDMPWLSGWNVIVGMQRDEDLRSIPVIVLSGHLMDGELPRDTMVIMKPFSHDVLVQTVRAVLSVPAEKARSRIDVLSAPIQIAAGDATGDGDRDATTSRSRDPR